MNLLDQDLHNITRCTIRYQPQNHRWYVTAEVWHEDMMVTETKSWHDFGDKANAIVWCEDRLVRPTNVTIWNEPETMTLGTKRADVGDVSETSHENRATDQSE
jgi:hypothetical protein